MQKVLEVWMEGREAAASPLHLYLSCLFASQATWIFKPVIVLLLMNESLINLPSTLFHMFLFLRYLWKIGLCNYLFALHAPNPQTESNNSARHWQRRYVQIVIQATYPTMHYFFFFFFCGGWVGGVWETGSPYNQVLLNVLIIWHRVIL